MLLRCERPEVAKCLSQHVGKAIHNVWVWDATQREAVLTYLKSRNPNNPQQQFRVAVSAQARTYTSIEWCRMPHEHMLCLCNGRARISSFAAQRELNVNVSTGLKQTL